jgi:hypothetical protein
MQLSRDRPNQRNINWCLPPGANFAQRSRPSTPSPGLQPEGNAIWWSEFSWSSLYGFCIGRRCWNPQINQSETCLLWGMDLCALVAFYIMTDPLLFDRIHITGRFNRPHCRVDRIKRSMNIVTRIDLRKMRCALPLAPFSDSNRSSQKRLRSFGRPRPRQSFCLTG